MQKGLYVHIPFCNQKCNYCDFLSFAKQDNALKERYSQALVSEIKTLKSKINFSFDTIYIGGGTPSSLNMEHLEPILKEILPLCSNIKEYSIETNPDSITMNKAKLFKKYGINRVSMGMQSANNNLLNILGRSHSVADVVKAVAILKQAGFTNLNLDLMYGLPQQTLADFKETLDIVLSLDVKHISMYQLKIEEGTPFFYAFKQHKLAEIDDDLAADMLILGQKMLSENGFRQYELSNYAKIGFESVHNKLYWLNEDYYAVGLGATGYNNGVRTVNEANLYKYFALVENGELSGVYKDELSLTEQMNEYIFMGLRLAEGINAQKFANRFQQDLFTTYAKAINKCVNLGLMLKDKTGIRLSDKGKMLGNLVFMEFID